MTSTSEFAAPPTARSYNIDPSRVKRLSETTVAKPVAEADEETFQRVCSMIEDGLKVRYSDPPDLSRNAAYKPYASVKIEGETIFTADNNGAGPVSEALWDKVKDAVKSAVGDKVGPARAQATVDAMAKVLKAKVEIAPTAISQAHWASIPVPVMTLNRDAMVQDPSYASLQRLQQDRTAFLAQQLAQESEKA